MGAFESFETFAQLYLHTDLNCSQLPVTIASFLQLLYFSIEVASSREILRLTTCATDKLTVARAVRYDISSVGSYIKNFALVNFTTVIHSKSKNKLWQLSSKRDLTIYDLK